MHIVAFASNASYSLILHYVILKRKNKVVLGIVFEISTTMGVS